MTRGASDTNVLPDLMRKWFGPNAGQPGTTFQVVFERSDEGYVLSPASNLQLSGPQLWTRYKRDEVPKLFGFEFKGREAQSGVVERPGLILLFVTLDKTDMQVEHRYEDAFLSPTEFRWHRLAERRLRQRAPERPRACSKRRRSSSRPRTAMETSSSF